MLDLSIRQSALPAARCLTLIRLGTRRKTASCHPQICPLKGGCQGLCHCQHASCCSHHLGILARSITVQDCCQRLLLMIVHLLLKARGHIRFSTAATFPLSPPLQSKSQFWWRDDARSDLAVRGQVKAVQGSMMKMRPGYLCIVSRRIGPL